MKNAFFGLGLAIFAVTVLVGCASPGAYKMYAGPDRPIAETAAVTFPYVLDVIAMDGEKASIPGPVKNSGPTYDLLVLPGHREMAVRYYDPFADYDDQYTDRSGANKPSITAPFFLTFNAVAGQQYKVEYQTAKQDSALERDEVKVWIVDQGSGETAGEMSTEEKGMPQATPPVELDLVAPAVIVDAGGNEAAEAPVVEIDEVQQDAGGKQLPAISSSDQLKFWWYRADAAERKDFLRWMREEK